MVTNGKIKLACHCRFLLYHHVTGCLCLSPSRGGDSCAVLPDSKEKLAALSRSRAVMYSSISNASVNVNQLIRHDD